MDYVYVCRSGENEELRYSLRALEKNAPEGRVWVVGGKPDWYIGDYLPVKQGSSKQENVKRNWIAVTSSPKISNSFVMMNDDFFIVESIDSIPVLNGGTLRNKVLQYKSIAPASKYTRILHDTYIKLKRLGYKEPLDYELHVPMQMSKKSIESAYRSGILMIRSAHGNFNNLGGELISDVKIYEEKTFEVKSFDYKSNRSAFLSSNDNTFDVLGKDILFDMFPDKSSYEK